MSEMVKFWTTYQALILACAGFLASLWIMKTMVFKAVRAGIWEAPTFTVHRKAAPVRFWIIVVGISMMVPISFIGAIAMIGTHL